MFRFIPTREAYYSELKKIGERINKFMDKASKELRQMNCYVSIGLSARMHSFDHLEEQEDWHKLAEELLAHQKALGIEIEDLNGLLAELWLEEREEKKGGA